MTVCMNHEVPCTLPCMACEFDCPEEARFDAECTHCGAGIDYIGGEFWGAAGGDAECAESAGGHEPKVAS